MKIIKRISVCVGIGLISLALGDWTHQIWLCGWIGGATSIAVDNIQNNA